MRTLARLLLLLPLLAGCSAAGVLNATIPTGGLRITRGVPYEPGPRHTMDIYQPATPAPGRPLVVFLYGGSWRSGDKAMYRFVAAPLARRGAVVVVPDYRLYPQVAYPAFLQDCAAATAYAIRNAAALGADPHAVFLLGHSAGAYNAAMLALDPHYLAAAGTSPAALAGVIAIAGPYDFLPITDPDIIPVFPSTDDKATQPITYADGHNPPMLLLAGTADDTVNPRNTTSLAGRIAAHGGPVETRLYPGIGHIGAITAFAPLFQGRAPVLADTWRFIQQHLPPAG